MIWGQFLDEDDGEHDVHAEVTLTYSDIDPTTMVRTFQTDEINDYVRAFE